MGLDIKQKLLQFKKEVSKQQHMSFPNEESHLLVKCLTVYNEEDYKSTFTDLSKSNDLTTQIVVENKTLSCAWWEGMLSVLPLRP